MLLDFAKSIHSATISTVVISGECSSFLVMTKTPKSNSKSKSSSSVQGVDKTKNRQQINIRLSLEDGQRLTELREYWATKGAISFLHKSESGTTVFDSNSTLARFIMETGLQYLHLDLINEKQIEIFARRICQERKSNKKLRQQWQLLSPNWESYKEKNKPEWKRYIDLVDELIKGQIAVDLFASEDDLGVLSWSDEDNVLFESIWSIALSRSHAMSDEDLADQTVLTRTQILEKKYGMRGD